MDVYECIKQAIEQKKQVHANYKGYSREMCPHVLGTKHGVLQALFYQFGGSSSRGLKGDGSDWRCIKLQDLEKVSVKEGKWHTGKVKTDRRSSCVNAIHHEVARDT